MPPESWWSRLWKPFWALPLVSIIIALVLGIAIPELDRLVADLVPFIFPGGPSGARSMLGVIASSTISVTGLVFSITMVVLQLSSSQFTPRVIGDFLDSRVTQATFGVFAGTFVYALTVMRAVGRPDADAAVPQTAVSVSFVLVVASVLTLLLFLHHITESIQVAKVLSRIGSHGVELIEELYPEEGDPPSPDPWEPDPAARRITIDVAERHGCTSQVDFEKLVSLATDAGSVVRIIRPMGSFHARGQRLAEIWTSPSTRDDAPDSDALVDAVRHCFRLTTEPSIRQDPSFSSQQIVDIAVRALSPGINDPTTAIQALNQIHRLARAAVQRPDPPSALVDDEEEPRLVYQPFCFGDLLDLGLDQIVHYGKSDQAVREKVLSIMDDLADCCQDEHRDLLDAKRREIEEAFAEAA